MQLVLQLTPYLTLSGWWPKFAVGNKLGNDIGTFPDFNLDWNILYSQPKSSIFYFIPFAFNIAWAAASLAIGTLKGEQET